MSNRPTYSLYVIILLRLKEMRVFLSTDGPNRNVLKFKPPMCFSKEDVDELVEKLELIFKEIEEDPEVTIARESEVHSSFKSNKGINGRKMDHDFDSPDRVSSSKKQKK